MKRFLYYNEDSVNSFLAQIENGLLVKENNTAEKTESLSTTNGVKSDVTGDLSAKVFGLGASLKGNLHADDSDTEVATNLIRSVQEKALHDYAFEKIYDYVQKENLVNNDNPQIGDIILVTETPTFLDFNYFKTLFSENGAIKYSNEQTQKGVNEQIDALKASVPKGAQIPLLIKNKIDEIKEQANKAEPQRKELLKVIEVLRNSLPHDRFVMTSNMLIPLDDKNFRDNPNIIAFKYGGEMTIMGYVTNIVSKEEKQISNNSFAPLYDAINKIMLNIFNNQDEIYIIHPIALFY